MSERVFTELKFADLDLESSVRLGLNDAGFEFCTPIQAASLPKALAGEDIAGQAQTGTGKTAAFLVATLNRLLRDPPISNVRQPGPRALVLAPTRELAIQIYEDQKVLGRHTGLKAGVVFGGTGYHTQREMLREGLDILIGTPGRIIDYYKQQIFGLKGIQVLVLDEADRMFDLGFIKDLRFLLRRMSTSEERLNLLFSATMSLRVSELAYEHMNAPTLINTNPDRVRVQRVNQSLYHVASDEKISLLIGLLRRMDPRRTMVFVNTKRAAEKVEAYLEGNGFGVGLLTGDIPQRKRMRLLEQFKLGEIAILVATDVASRGLHIPDVSHVVNFDLPQDAEDYVHRVGRTARVGASGDAVSFACEEFVFSLEDIEAFLSEKIPSEPLSDELLVAPQPPARRAPAPRRGRGGRPGRSRRRPATAGS